MNEAINWSNLYTVGVFLMIGMLFKNENLFHLSFSREKPVTTASAKKDEIDQLDISSDFA
ncbi:hypothetical protein ACEQPO_24745 [Bacillus sp. SL00103]